MATNEHTFERVTRNEFEKFGYIILIFLGCLTSKASFKIDLRTAGETSFQVLQDGISFSEIMAYCPLLKIDHEWC